MILKELTINEFNAFTSNNYISVYQCIEYANTMNYHGFDYIYYGIIDNNIIYGASLILIKKIHGFKYAYVPRGYIINYNNYDLIKEFTDQLKRALKKKGVVGMIINPPIVKSIYQNKQLITNNNYDLIFNNLKFLKYKHLGYNNYFEGLKPRFEAVIPLSKNILKLFNNINKSFRTKIRSADSNGIKIFKGDKKDLNNLFTQTKNKYPRDLKYFEDLYDSFKDLIEIYYAKLNTSDYVRNVQYKYQRQALKCNEANANVFKNVKNNNTKTINRKLYEENKLNLIREELVYATKLLKDYPDGIIAASILIIKNKTEVYMIMDGYDKEYKKMNAKHLLIWKLMEKFANDGYKTFNLGGISNYNLSNNKYSGLTNFKLGFGSNVYEYMGDLELVINKPFHIMYKQSSAVIDLLKK